MVCFLLLNHSDVRCITVYYYTMKEVTLPHFCNHPMSRSEIWNKVISTTTTSTTDGGEDGEEDGKKLSLNQIRHTVTSRVTWKKVSLISNQTHSHITRDLEEIITDIKSDTQSHHA